MGEPHACRGGLRVRLTQRPSLAFCHSDSKAAGPKTLLLPRLVASLGRGLVPAPDERYLRKAPAKKKMPFLAKRLKMGHTSTRPRHAWARIKSPACGAGAHRGRPCTPPRAPLAAGVTVAVRPGAGLPLGSRAMGPKMDPLGPKWTFVSKNGTNNPQNRTIFLK